MPDHVQEEEDNAQHLLVDLFGCNEGALASLEAIRDLLVNLARDANMRAIAPPYVFHYDAGGDVASAGITGFLVIAESHVSVHTYPETRRAFVDLFSCRTFDSEGALEVIKRLLSPERLTTLILPRGISQ